MALCAVKCQRAYVNLIHQNRFCKSLNMSIIMRSLIPNPIGITSIYKERTKHIITHILKDVIDLANLVYTVLIDTFVEYLDFFITNR